MQDQTKLLDSLKQHHHLSIRVTLNCNAQVPADIYRQLLTPHRSLHYVFILVMQGKSVHTVDMETFTVHAGQLLFVLPHQAHLVAPREGGISYFTLNFEERCLSLLPKPFLFLLNPLYNQLLTFDAGALQRVRTLFEMLSQLLAEPDMDMDLVLSNLNTLLTELNRTYLANHKKGRDTDGHLSRFIAFKTLVEAEFMEQPPVQAIAARLSLTTNSLYSIVKHYSGLSPKAFIINRLMVEAQRRLYYSETSVKTLAYELGFSDPGYFSRLFRKSTGKSITHFVKEVQDLSGN